MRAPADYRPHGGVFVLKRAVKRGETICSCSPAAPSICANQPRRKATRLDREHGAFNYRAFIFAAIQGRWLPKSSQYPRAAFRIHVHSAALIKH